jgi:magnesium transporter
MADITTEKEIRDEWGSLAPDFIAEVQAALVSGDSEALRAEARDLHAADLADLIEALEPDQRVGSPPWAGPSTARRWPSSMKESATS